jgi:hypothetical protein
VEKWKIIEDFPAYEVSDLGRIRRRLPGRGTQVGKILKPFPNRLGYYKVSFGKKRVTVHTLVARAFIPNPKGLPEVNHLGPKSDCRASQLEWRTHVGNMQHHLLKQKESGVWFVSKYKKWTARYGPVPNEEVHLGFFKTKKEAKKARKAAIEKLPYVL